jgi:hypothetical protein
LHHRLQAVGGLDRVQAAALNKNADKLSDERVVVSH